MIKLAESRDEWTKAKRHVAIGHEREQRRLKGKGRLIGGTAGATVTGLGLVHALGRKKWPGLITAAAVPAGLGLGHLLGEREALKRLELSQRRGESGHYAPMPKKAGIIEDTAVQARSEIRATKRPLVKPIVHKPMVVKTPAPKPPTIAPPTQTPTQMTPVEKMGALAVLKKRKKAKAAVDDMGGGASNSWQGQKIRQFKPGPENEPLSESWRGHDF